MLALRGGREKGKRTAVTTAINKNYEIFPFFILFLMMLLFINPAGLLAVPLPPQNLGIHDGVGGSEVTLEWNSNSEPDLAGYIVYWDIDSGPPYANEQNVGPNTSYTLSGLTQDVYYTAVTAYDTEGGISNYSEELVINNVPLPPAIALLGTGVLGLGLWGWRRKGG